MKTKLDEGFWKADRIETKIFADSKEELLAKLEPLKNRDKNHDPKVSNVTRDRSGRFVVIYSYLKNENDNKEDIFSKIGRGINKTKEVVKKVSDNIPRQGTLTDTSGFELGKKMASFSKDHPDVRYGKKIKNDKGDWEITYFAKPTQKTSSTNDNINNIQKAINKLSDNDKKLLKI